ncbi:voltage-gated potassium channel [Cutaneotrichosporon oleaginosum]|uniref:Voltage-gated potassium channel n=1 Tax=Cutaneotrichosporon oleaginosum TaxID=879819 RepID=A0A0J0XLK0_9TREE|nr:voltage-gated potassium channel [Cutaneotrichosporon oleaginosum]KLT41971.1 voltage-gated potassium channel [Cutaneotrichosporon oleaginosum]TXT14368.1 hypothetical protein COLE_00561 [Cutaneotrichosporon oleaginosum]
MSYANPLAGEEYELAPSASAGASASTNAPLERKTSRGRKLTLHPNQSTLLFAGPARRRGARRASSNLGAPDSPREAKYNRTFFLQEDLDQLGPDREEVNLPDFGHMLGLDVGEDHFAVAAAMRSAWKRKLYLLMEEPSSGREAFFVHVAVTAAIFFSVILTTFSTLPAFHTNPTSVRVLFAFDTTIVVLFTVEYLARTFAHADSWGQYYKWATSFFAVTDLLSILPYYIELARQEDTSILFRFSILRTFRLLRVFRAFRYQSQMLLTIEVMYVAVRRSKDALVAISYFIFLVLVLFSTLIYFAERGTWDATLGAFVDPDGDVSLFDSIPQTAWYALVTMSTAGYGDVVPKTALGKILSVPLLLFGLLLIALPSFVLGRNFAIVYDAMVSFQAQAVSLLVAYLTPAIIATDAARLAGPRHARRHHDARGGGGGPAPPRAEYGAERRVAEPRAHVARGPE